MWRKIKPDNGYCFYFPNRPEGNRCIAGQSVRVGWWEEWKHIKLGQFEVKFSNQQEQELITTEENLQCRVIADFKIVVGGREEGREERLKRATLSCPPTKSIKDKVELEFFQKWATNFCKNSIKRIVKECKFLDLLEKVDYRANAAKRVKADLENNLESIGLLLVESTVVIEPLKPDGPFATKQILDTWLEFRKVLDRAGIADMEAESEKKEAEVGLLQQSKIRDLERASELRDTERKLEIKEKEQIRQKEEAIRGITQQLKIWEKEARLFTIQLQDEVDREEERKKEEAESRKRQSERQALQDDLEKIQIQRKVRQEENELVELREQVAATEIRLDRAKEELRVEIVEKEMLAKSADTIKMRELLVSALPKILEEANRPMEKMGEMRTLNFVGMSDKMDKNGLVGGLLGSISTLPMVKEVIRFLRELENEDVQEKRENREQKKS